MLNMIYQQHKEALPFVLIILALLSVAFLFYKELQAIKSYELQVKKDNELTHNTICKEPIHSTRFVYPFDTVSIKLGLVIASLSAAAVNENRQKPSKGLTVGLIVFAGIQSISLRQELEVIHSISDNPFNDTETTIDIDFKEA